MTAGFSSVQGQDALLPVQKKIYRTFQDIVKDAPGVTLEFAPHDEKEHVGIKKTGCQGFCELGPLVRIQKGDNVIQYIKVQPDDCADIFEKSVRRDEVIEELLYKQKEKVYRHPDEIPFIAKADACRAGKLRQV